MTSLRKSIVTYRKEYIDASIESVKSVHARVQAPFERGHAFTSAYLDAREKPYQIDKYRIINHQWIDTDINGNFSSLPIASNVMYD